MPSNVAASSTTSLYQSTGNVRVLNNAQQLLNTLSNNGNVGFALDTLSSNTRVLAYALTGGGSGTYGNAEVAAYLPTYTGSLANSTDIIALTANAAAQATDITTLFANAAVQATDIGTLTANAATQQGQIDAISGNLTAFEIYANATFTTGNVSANVTLTGDVTGTGNTGTPIATTLANSGVVAGSYGSDVLIPYITVDAKGRITQITTNAVSGGGSYGNSNVAAYLPIYTGSLSNSTTIQTLDANLGTATTNITTLFANAAVQSANIATLFANAASQAISINTIDANLGTATTNIATLFANAATQATAIQTLDANLGTATNNITTLFANAATQAQTLANLGTMSTQNATAVNITGGNISAYNVTATNKLASPYLDATTSAGGALRNASGTNQIQWGSGGGNNVTVDVSTNLNGSNAQIDISPTGTGHVHIKPTGAGSLDIAPTNTGYMNNVTIGNITPAAAIFTTVQTSGNITANAGAFFIGDGSKLTGISSGGTYGLTGDVTASGTVGSNAVATLSSTGVTAGTYGSDTLIPQITVDVKGRITSVSNVSAAGGSYGNANVAAYLPTYGGQVNTNSIITNSATDLNINTGANGNLNINPGTSGYLNLGTASTGAPITISTYGSTFSGSHPIFIESPANIILNSNIQMTGIMYNTNSGRIIANAYPLSTPITTIPNNSYSKYVQNIPTYTNGVLQQPPLANATPGGTGVVNLSSQVIGFIQSANVGLQSGYAFGSQNRDTVNALFQTSITPVTANSMSNQDRVRGLISSLDLNSYGTTYGTMSSTSQNATTISALNGFINYNGYGNVSTLMGGNYGSFITPTANQNANVQYATSVNSFLTLLSTAATTGKANVVYARMLSGGITGFSSNLTVQYAVGLHTYSGWSGSGAVGSANNPILGRFAVLNEDANTVIQTNGNVTITGNTNLGPYKETVAALGNQTGTITANYFSGTVQTLTATGNITLNTNNVTNMPTGGSLTLIITQDGTGGRVLTSNLKYAGASKTLSTAGGSIDVLNIFYDGTNYLASLVKGYA